MSLFDQLISQKQVFGNIHISTLRNKQQSLGTPNIYYISNHGINISIQYQKLVVRTTFPFDLYDPTFYQCNNVQSFNACLVIHQNKLLLLDYITKQEIQAYVQEQIDFYVNKQSILINKKRKFSRVVIWKQSFSQWNYSFKRRLIQNLNPLAYSYQNRRMLLKLLERQGFQLHLNSIFDEKQLQSIQSKWTNEMQYVKYGMSKVELQNKIIKQVGQGYLNIFLEELKKY